MPDRLASLLTHFAVRAETFQTGALCGISPVPTPAGCGQLHLIREGRVEVHHGAPDPLLIEEPSVLLYPRPLAHRFITDSREGAHFVCANVAFEGGASHPIAAALPPWICLPLTAVAPCEPVLQMMFFETGHGYCGRQAVLDRLFEVLLIWLLRVLMDQGKVQSGMLAGMSHAKLKLALIAMHDTPQRDWSLNDLANEAGMSRTVFANGFRDVVGCTPAAYLQGWRIGLAQKGLRAGRALKHIASDVGYSGEASLSRAFRDHVGVSPREWLKQTAAVQ
ncbi:AraC family transcriptional regulator [Mitsuaria sp. 7]|uniref:AraC family transcriptional regulator n=1 Tax=Mitsuaria sp. 7 TaxID=1658665 RepID=UPI0007DD4C77|nr:AraC family transcriptional regulator [Mitsuaria sp. 7]ANH69944.1 AraC family transcriptional regulator [Mitsuaria sp. 7]